MGRWEEEEGRERISFHPWLRSFGSWSLLGEAFSFAWGRDPWYSAHASVDNLAPMYIATTLIGLSGSWKEIMELGGDCGRRGLRATGSAHIQNTLYTVWDQGSRECTHSKYIVYSMRLGQGSRKCTHSKYIVCSMRLGLLGVHMFKIHCVQCETLKEGTEKGGERRCRLLALQELLFWIIESFLEETNYFKNKYSSGKPVSWSHPSLWHSFQTHVPVAFPLQFRPPDRQVSSCHRVLTWLTFRVMNGRYFLCSVSPVCLSPGHQLLRVPHCCGGHNPTVSWHWV